MRAPILIALLSAGLVATEVANATPDAVQLIERQDGRVEAVIVPAALPAADAARQPETVDEPAANERETAAATDDTGRRWWRFWRWFGD